MAGKTLVSNRRASFDYAFSSNLTAGLVLSGAETKSLKNGQGSLKGSYVSVRGEQAYLINAHISPYKYAGEKGNGNPDRDRKLLLNKREIKSLIGKEKGLIAIPTEIFENGRGLIKLGIGIGRSKKKFDKREAIKQRDIKKRIRERVDA